MFISVCPHGKILAQVADFGWSFLPHDGDKKIIYPAKSRPWNAPEYHHRGFTIEQVQKQDVFSFGMLCFWVMFHTSISAEAGDSLDGHCSLLEDWKVKRKLQAIALDMVAASDHSKMTKEILARLFSSTLAHDPNERDIDFERLENMFRKLDPTWYILPALGPGTLT